MCQNSKSADSAGWVARRNGQLAHGFSILAWLMNFLSRGHWGIGPQCAARLHVTCCCMHECAQAANPAPGARHSATRPPAHCDVHARASPPPPGRPRMCVGERPGRCLFQTKPTRHAPHLRRHCRRCCCCQNQPASDQNALQFWHWGPTGCLLRADRDQS